MESSKKKVLITGLSGYVALWMAKYGVEEGK